MRFDVISVFPRAFESFLSTSLFGRAIKEGLVDVRLTNPRDFATDRHRSVDDTPYGGGEGMVMRPEPLVSAVESVAAGPRAGLRRVLLTPQGKRLTQADLRRLATMAQVVFICGRYEGFDERVRLVADEEVSLGDYVLNGGEVAAMALMEGIGRLLPGVLGNASSAEEESHAQGLLEYPQYTRPRDFRGVEVPGVLLSGDHGEIARWRLVEQMRRTRRRRPDLWRRYSPPLAEHARLARSLEGESLRPLAARTYAVLVHHPVVDRDGKVVTTALTNLDLHDIARSARTYELGGYYLVSPIESQRCLAERIIGHWTEGHGRRAHAPRRDALALVRIVESLSAAAADIADRHGGLPALVAATTARRTNDQTPLSDFLGSATDQPRPIALLFGTGWGLAPSVMEQADLILSPVTGVGEYNHLSVRSAASIMLDRLFGMRDETLA